MTKPAAKTAAASEKKILKGARATFNFRRFSDNSAIRATTPEEIKAWEDSDRSKGMTDAGELKLAPRIASIELTSDQEITIERARCSIQLGYSRQEKMTAIKIDGDDRTYYCKRARLTAI